MLPAGYMDTLRPLLICSARLYIEKNASEMETTGIDTIRVMDQFEAIIGNPDIVVVALAAPWLDVGAERLLDAVGVELPCQRF